MLWNERHFARSLARSIGIDPFFARRSDRRAHFVFWKILMKIKSIFTFWPLGPWEGQFLNKSIKIMPIAKITSGEHGRRSFFSIASTKCARRSDRRAKKGPTRSIEPKIERNAPRSTTLNPIDLFPKNCK